VRVRLQRRVLIQHLPQAKPGTALWRPKRDRPIGRRRKGRMAQSLRY
jgi:hypothetical protein